MTVIIRDLATQEDYLACVKLQDETWGDTFAERVPPAILRVAQRIGGVSAGAFDDTGRMIGFVFGMTGLREGRLVHWSDMLAVRSEYRDQNLGRRLKQYQRDKVHALGVERMFWTFDPLVARNAHFNINILGALPEEYVPDMYGSDTGSALHGRLPTDRLIAGWDLRVQSPESRVQSPEARGQRPETGGQRPEAKGQREVVVIDPLDVGGVPRIELDRLAGEVAVRVQIPRDFGEVQRDADQAMAWRLAVREAMLAAFERGFRVTGFDRAHGDVPPCYVLTRPAAGPPS